MNNNDIIKFAEEVAAECREATESTPSPDSFDWVKFPYGAAAGSNMLGFLICTTCGKPPTTTEIEKLPRVFLFRDKKGVAEYHLSGMCQACQDFAFSPSNQGD